MTSFESPQTQLKVAIVGAGLAGLTEAVGLRMEGHEVHIFESSSINREISAAISLTANALRVLTYLGVNVKNLRAGDNLGVMWFNSEGGEGKFDALYDPHNTFGRYGILCHRSELHDELKRLATAEDRPGRPVTINLKCEALRCDPVTGTLTLKNGEVNQADLIIGADGIHARTSPPLINTLSSSTSGGAAFRCLLETSKMEGDKTLVNIVAYIPDPRDQDKFSKCWNAPSTKEDLVRAFEDYDTQFTALLALLDGPVHLANPRSALPAYVDPGVRAAMSIEDAVTIACLLPRETPKDQIPRRLEGYQTLRKFVLTESVEQVPVPSKRGLYGRSREMQAFIAGHDAVKVAREYLATHSINVE
ncbi:hypothetical protein B0H17DRAFT_1207490 [Mycena rosella]|uniref:FAD-binding domain-containing protein n=1 Tax=Mycena rosella TaxID=1033263 RepID=A0AAD7D2S9_MYCRO|nr:hypothetical protein B0H17DRAFT_1207490 [Mycena rosella]